MDTQIEQPETWQVESNGSVFDASLDEIAAWIGDGSLLKIDRVRKGNLRWIEAGKVPALGQFFNAKDAAEPTAPIVTVTHTEVLGRPRQILSSGVNVEPPATAVGSDTAGGCAMHPDAPVRYICDTCSNQFCKACPTGYGSNVKICPFCGAMCSPKEVTTTVTSSSGHYAQAGSVGAFGFGDFGAALAFPFRFKASLIIGAIMFAFFQIAGGGSPFGGVFMMGAGLMCAMASNMISFAVMSNTIDNFAKGDLDSNFMPSFDDFNIWDDVVHPFFLSIAVYISSFGPLIAVVLIAVFFIVGSIKEDPSLNAADSFGPQYSQAPKALSKGEQLRQMANAAAVAQKRRTQVLQNGEVESDKLDGQALQKAEDERFEQLNGMIQNQRQQQLESAVGKTPETVTQEREAMIKKIMSYGVLFLIVGGITLIWGLFYFPAACAVAGYTRSFGATLNPTVGLDTIRRLGGSYALILAMCFLLAIASGFLNGILGVAFAAFNMPSVGNIPAKILGSFVSFYFWIVFSGILGFALYRSSDKLALVR